MNWKGLLSASAACLALAALAETGRPAAGAGTADVPAYAANGDLLPLPHYREWVYLTSGIDMSYTAQAAMPGSSMFDNVFVNPAAYRGFLATGKWPDKTIMALEIRGAESKGSINQRGHFQSKELMGFEVHVKDETRFPGQWAFFEFDAPDKNGTLIPQGAPCYSCHAAHGAVDTTFVQFYPTLLPLAEKRGTLSESYRKEEAAKAAGKK